MNESDLRSGNAKTATYGSDEMLKSSPADRIPHEPTIPPEIAYQMVKDETYAQTQPQPCLCCPEREVKSSGQFFLISSKPGSLRH